jgi:hypothetical protein
MRQPVRAIVRWSAIEVVVVQVLGGWLSPQVGWPVTYPASWAVYVLAGREGSWQGPLRYAFMAGGAVALVAHVFSAARLGLKGLDYLGLEFPPRAIFMLVAVSLGGAAWGLLGGLIGRLHQRRALLAFLIGVAPVLLAITQLKSRTALAKLILWPAILIGGLVPGHEGTPVHLLAAIFGIVLSAILYSGIAYALLSWIRRGRPHREDLHQVGT